MLPETYIKLTTHLPYYSPWPSPRSWSRQVRFKRRKNQPAMPSNWKGERHQGGKGHDRLVPETPEMVRPRVSRR